MNLPNSTEEIILALQAITAASFGLGLLFTLLSVMAFRRSRNDAMWRYRRQASRQGFRFSLLAVLGLGVGSAFCLTTLTVMYVENQESETAPPAPLAIALDTTAAATPSLESAGSPSPSPSQTVQQMPTESIPTLEGTPIPQILPEIYPPTAEPLPIRLEIRAIDDVITDNWQPIQPDKQFSTTTQRFYFFLAYEGLDQGMLWGQQLWKDGQLLQERTQIWGLTETSGETVFFFGNPAGFAAGNYEIRLTMGNDQTLLASLQFLVLPA